MEMGYCRVVEIIHKLDDKLKGIQAELDRLKRELSQFKQGLLWPIDTIRELEEKIRELEQENKRLQNEH